MWARTNFRKRKATSGWFRRKLDVPLKNARWELYLPPEYAYTKFEGSMTHEAERRTGRASLFLGRVPRSQEEQKKIARKSSVASFLSKSRRGLAEGKVKEANDELVRQCVSHVDDEDTKKELEGLKRDLGRVQSSNLIQAQRAYSLDNFNRYSGGVQANAPADAPAQQAAQRPR